MKDQGGFNSKYPRLLKFNDAVIRFCTNVPNPIPTTYGFVIVCIYITFSYIKYTHFDFKNEGYDYEFTNYAKEWNEEVFLINLSKLSCTSSVVNIVYIFSCIAS